MGADDDHAAAGGELSAEVAGAGEELTGVVDAVAQEVGEELAGGLLGGPLGRPDPLDLGGDQGAHEPEQRRLGVARPEAHAQAADGGIGDLELDRQHVIPALDQRALVGR